MHNIYNIYDLNIYNLNIVYTVYVSCIYTQTYTYNHKYTTYTYVYDTISAELHDLNTSRKYKRKKERSSTT